MSKPFVQNAADESQVKSAAKKSVVKREQELSDVRHLLSLPQGRRFIWRYMAKCRMNESSFDASGSKVYFNEGMRNVGLAMLADVTEANPQAYVTMINENSKEQEDV